MDMIKKELEDDSNSFELSCVKVEVEEIKSELVNFFSTLQWLYPMGNLLRIWLFVTLHFFYFIQDTAKPIRNEWYSMFFFSCYEWDNTVHFFGAYSLFISCVQSRINPKIEDKCILWITIVFTHFLPKMTLIFR